jgi:hypothetical protein
VTSLRALGGVRSGLARRLSSKAPANQSQKQANAGKREAYVPKGNQAELELAWGTNIVAGTDPHEMHDYISSNQ